MNDSNILRGLYVFLSTIPGWTLLFIYTFVLRAYIVLDRLPTPGNPDPFVLNFHVHQTLASLFQFVVIFSFVFWLGFTWIAYRKRIFSERFLITHIVIYTVLYISFFLVRLNDPGYLFAWLAD